MDPIQIVVLALLQGLTEFLPISSSAHLILVPVIIGWPDQGLAFDVAVHVGTLAAVVLYFRNELVTMGRAWWSSLGEQRFSPEAQLGWAVLWGTMPVGLAGLLFQDIIETELRSPLLIAGTTIVFGLLLWAADRWGWRRRDEYSLRWRDVLIIGCVQAVALIPGTSRSGATITAGLMMGLSRSAAARFSFLLSIPVILLAGGLKIRDLLQHPEAVDWLSLLLGTSIAALSAYLCIHFFLKLLEQTGLLPFVLYRLVLGGVLLLVFW